MTEPSKSRERRKNTRERKKMEVRFGPGELAHTGTTRDFSARGLCLQAGTIYPPSTILVMKVDLPDGAATFRGIVRWSRDPGLAARQSPGGRIVPAVMRKSLLGGMGVEFTDTLRATVSEPAPSAEPPASPPPVRPKRGIPPEASEENLRRAPTRRRQISTLAGNTFEVHETEYRGALYVRLIQLPLTDGSHQSVFEEAFWTREEADAAVKAFLKGR